MPRSGLTDDTAIGPECEARSDKVVIEECRDRVQYRESQQARKPPVPGQLGPQMNQGRQAAQDTTIPRTQVYAPLEVLSSQAVLHEFIGPLH